MAEHLQVLREYNAWRRGDDARGFSDTGLAPAAIGQAIDATVIECERSRRVLERIAQLCTSQHESKEAFARRVQSVIEWGGLANG